MVRGIQSLICVNFRFRIGGFGGGVPTFGCVWLLRKPVERKGRENGVFDFCKFFFVLERFCFSVKEK